MLDPFGRSQLPPAFDRQARVDLIGQAARDLLAGRLPSREACMFLGGAITAWLNHGGRVGELERTYLQTTGPERSRLTPAALWQRSCARTATDDTTAGTMSPSSPPPPAG